MRAFWRHVRHYQAARDTDALGRFGRGLAWIHAAEFGLTRILTDKFIFGWPPGIFERIWAGERHAAKDFTEQHAARKGQTVVFLNPCGSLPCRRRRLLETYFHGVVPLVVGRPLAELDGRAVPSFTGRAV